MTGVMFESLPLLEGLRVLELSSEPAVEMAGKTLAESGAAVTKLCAPDEPSRRRAPFRTGTDESLHFLFYNVHKQIVEWQPADPGSRSKELERGRETDVVLSSLLESDAAAVGQDYATFSRKNPAVIHCAITPFGQEGPWSRYRGSDLVSFAASGMLQLCGYDDHSLPPVVPGGPQAANVAATFAVNGVLIALIDRLSSGLGQFLDVSIHDSGAVSLDMANPYWFYPKTLVHRQTSRGAAPMPTQRAIFLGADGRWLQVHLAISEELAWRRFVAWLAGGGLSLDLSDESYSSVEHRRLNAGHIYEVLEAFVGLHSAEELFWSAQEHGVPAGLIYAPEELPRDPHLAARGTFQPLRTATPGATILFPTSPLRWSGAKAADGEE